MSEKQEGSIKFFNNSRFFGFILTDKGDVFFHGKDCQCDPAVLKRLSNQQQYQENLNFGKKVKKGV